MILLFTDFGEKGPYLGQMTAKLRMCGFTGDVINLMADAPAFSVKASARLLAAYGAEFPKNSVFLAIVDPGVGSARNAIVVRSGRRWFAGPDNGIFEYVLRQDATAEAWEIVWRPDRLSASFHGRDLFAPIAADIAAAKTADKLVPIDPDQLVRFGWPADLPEIVYIDHYGNAMTGIEAKPGIETITVGDRELPLSATFSDAAIGQPLAYENSSGMIEIAVNQGRADDFFNLSVGSEVLFSRN